MRVLFTSATYLVFQQSNRVSAIKHMLFCYRLISVSVFFHLSVCSLLVPCVHLKYYLVACGCEDIIQYRN